MLNHRAPSAGASVKSFGDRSKQAIFCRCLRLGKIKSEAAGASVGGWSPPGAFCSWRMEQTSPRVRGHRCLLLRQPQTRRVCCSPCPRLSHVPSACPLCPIASPCRGPHPPITHRQVSVPGCGDGCHNVTLGARAVVGAGMQRWVPGCGDRCWDAAVGTGMQRWVPGCISGYWDAAVVARMQWVPGCGGGAGMQWWVLGCGSGCWDAAAVTGMQWWVSGCDTGYQNLTLVTGM